MRRGVLVLAFTLLIFTMPALAAGDEPVRIGVLTDKNGAMAELAGEGSVVAARMAVEDFGGTLRGLPIEIVAAFHQNRPGIGKGLARQWVEKRGVKAIVDVPNTMVALAVNEVVRDTDKVLLLSSPGSSRLTGEACSPNTIQWTYSNAELVRATVAGVNIPGTRWFLIAGDNAYGRDLAQTAIRAIENGQSTVSGRLDIAANLKDPATILRQANASGADIVGLALRPSQSWRILQEAAQAQNLPLRFAAFTLALQPQNPAPEQAAIPSVTYAAPFASTMNKATRDFATRFADRMNHRPPSMIQAGVYAAVLHYLNALDKLGPDSSGAALVAEMKTMVTGDPLFGKTTIQPSGLAVHDMVLMERPATAASTASAEPAKTVPVAQIRSSTPDAGPCPLTVNATADMTPIKSP